MGATRNTGYLENLIQYDASDNVAIATSVNPSYKVTLGGSLLGTSAVFSSSVTSQVPNNTSVPQFSCIQTGGNTYGVIGINRNDGTGIATGLSSALVIRSGNATDYPIQFATANNIRLTIASEGNVGIGTASPSDKLTVTDASTYTFNIGAASGGAGAVLYTLGSAALTFATNGSANERMRITSGGNVLIGGTVVQNSSANRGNLTINGTTSILNLSTSDTNAGYLYHGGTDMLLVNAKNGATLFYTNDTERMRITSGGKVLVNLTGSIVPNTASIELSGQGTDTSTRQPAYNILANHGNNGTWRGYFTFHKSRGTTQNTFTVVSSGDELGTIRWNGADGSGYVTAAEINAQVDGTPGVNDMPGRLVFLTTADGASSPTERMRLKSDGQLLMDQAGGNSWKLYINQQNLLGGENGIYISSGYYPAIHLSGNSGTTGGGKWVINSFATGYGSGSLAGAMLLQSDKALQFSTNGDNVAMTITTGQNVLIGTTSDSGGRLQVSGGDVRVSGGIRFSSSGADANRWSVYWNGGTGDLIVVNNISDIRAKKDFDYNIKGLETIQKLKPLKFTWKDGTSHSTSVSGRLRQYGFIAQETMEADDFLAWYNESQDSWGIEQYESFSAVIVKAIQEQQAQIEELKSKLS